MENHKKTIRIMTSSVMVFICLSICLCITTFALVWSIVTVDDNYFHTGNIEIDLNNGKPVIEEHEFLFEPGMTVVKDFYIQNNSTWDVYYKLYFDNIEGGLADVLEVTIKDKDNVLYSGKPSELTRKMVSPANDTLHLKEKKELQIVFHYPAESGNSTQDVFLTFTLCADAVQTKNNPDKKFD